MRFAKLGLRASLPGTAQTMRERNSRTGASHSPPEYTYQQEAIRMSTNMNDKHGTTDVVSADEAIKRLREGNARYLEAKTAQGDVSPQIRRSTFEEGQHPFAIVLACSDSRVIPEAIFSAGIGDLFTIRVAGNVVDNHQLGSVEYAESHLNCKLVVVLGHTGCGAVDAAMHHEPYGSVKFITDEISDAIGDEADEATACLMNVAHSVKRIEESRQLHDDEVNNGLRVIGALYHTDTGVVEFLE